MVKTRSGNKKKGITTQAGPELVQSQVEHIVQTTMAEASDPLGKEFKGQLAKMTEAMEAINRTMGDMNKGLSTRLDGLTTRLDAVDASNKKIQTNAEENMASANVKFAQLESLLNQTEQDHKLTERKLKVAEAKLAASEFIKGNLVERINYIENRLRVCNVIIDGCTEEEGENLIQYVSQMIGYIAKQQIDDKSILSAYRIGKKQQHPEGYYPGKKRPRPIKVTFDSMQTRNVMYYARASLKGSQMYNGVYISDDVTLDTKKAREAYRSVAALARSQNTDVKLHDDGIVLEGRKFRLFEADSLPEKYSLKNAKTIEVNGSIYFHSDHSYLSNFYYAPMLIDGLIYLTAEHRLQYVKSIVANDLRTAHRITTAPSALEAKRLGDGIRETPEWRLKREAVLNDVLNAKFTQNKDLAANLIATGDKKLHEATASSYYGIGAGLHSRQVRDGTHTGENKLGHALQKLRTELNGQGDLT